MLKTGWSESWTDLTNDRQLRSKGSGFEVNVIILVEMFRPALGIVKANIEVTTYGTTGIISTVTQVWHLVQFCL